MYNRIPPKEVFYNATWTQVHLFFFLFLSFFIYISRLHSGKSPIGLLYYIL